MTTRPTLADHVAARWHLVSGDRFVILHDTRTGRVARIGPREWTLIRCADGTRDAAGIVAAAAAQGRIARPEDVATFFAELDQAGMLAAGPPPEPEPVEPPPPDRPLRVLPDFRLRCDGTGTCCRLYPTTAFAPVEVARARVHAPAVLDCALAPEEVFTPEFGSTAPPWRARAVAMVDGRCAFLSAAGRCELHESGGAGAKPRGCAHFPATFVDDGEAVRVSVAPECACVFDSAASDVDEGEPLVPAAAQRLADLDASAYVTRLPPEREVTAGIAVPTRRLVQLGDEVLRRVVDLDERCDAARLWWALAGELSQGGAEIGEARSRDLGRRVLARAAGAPGGEGHDRLALQLDRLGAVLDRRFDQDRDWRAEADLARVVPRLMRDALPAVVQRGWQLPALADEAFHLRAYLHGHLWLTAVEAPQTPWLEQLAVRLLVARAVATAITPAERAAEPAFAHPLALVEAVGRSLVVGAGAD